jgi:hypothetical protein
MEYETYADVIDAYNADNMGYSTLTDYIKGQNIKIKEIEMDPIGDMQKIFENKADGGMIGIEVLFGPKRDDFRVGGAAGREYGANTSASRGVRTSPSRGPSRDDRGPTMRTQTKKPVFKSDIAPQFQGLVQPAAGVKFDFLKKQKFYNQPFKLEDVSAMEKAGADAAGTLSSLEKLMGGKMTVGNVLENMAGGSYGDIPSTTQDKLKEQILGKVDFGDTFPKNFSFGNITPTIEGGRIDIDETKLDDDAMAAKKFLDLKDGGRVGFFMGGPALEGQALQIYNSMNAYGFTDQEIADALSARGLYTPAGSGTTTTAPEGIIGAQLNQGSGRDDNRTGFGKFGNLDPTTEKTFIKDVYTIDRNAAPGAPMTGSFKPTEVTGYLNVNTGNYQTLEGKNINHAGLNIKPGILAIAEALGLGPIDETQFTGLPSKEGQIAGTFTGKKLSDFNPLNLFKKQQATVAEINAMNQKAIKDMQEKQRAEEAAKRRELENRIISGGANISGGGGGGNITTSAGTFAPGDYSDVAGTLADPREKMDYYRDGGLATMFTRRR